MGLAQVHNTVKPMKLKPAAPLSRVKYSTTEPLCPLFDPNAHTSKKKMVLLEQFNPLYTSHSKMHTLANSEDPDELPHVAFHQGIHCLLR